MQLHTLRKGDRGKIIKIDADRTLRNRLNTFGIVPGEELTVKALSPAGETIEIEVGNTLVALRASEAKKIQTDIERSKREEKHAAHLAALLLAATAVQTGGKAATAESLSTTESLTDTLETGTISGQIRTGYLYTDPKLAETPSIHATALGGQLKYETGKWYGFDLGAAFYTSHAIDAASGDKSNGTFNDGLSSEAGHYDLLAEAYLDYSYENFKIRGGRQLIDTPYADSDDIRMTPNTFEGIVANYTYNDFNFIGAWLTRWQGPDAEVYKFVDLLENGSGVALLSVGYQGENIEASLWYYHADNTANVLYGQASYGYHISEELSFKGSLQVGNQSEIDRSGFDGTIYGAMAELNYFGWRASFAYDRLLVDKDKEYFGGFGGGVGFANMFEMTAGIFTFHQNATAWKGTLMYDLSDAGINGLTLEYDFGHFRGDSHHKAKEHNFILTYAPTERWNIELVYDRTLDVYMDMTMDNFGHPVDYSFDRLLVRANYNF